MNRDTPLYKIMSLERFHELLCIGKNVLVHPSTWDDPFEKEIDETTVVVQDGDEIRMHSVNGNYWWGQSWSLNKQSDAMWQLYAPDRKKRYVKIKTTYGLLEDSCKISKEEEEQTISFFTIQELNYVPNEKDKINESISKWVEEFKSYIPEELQTSLGRILTKRDSFTHEAEVRLIRYLKPLDNDDKNGNVCDSTLYKYRVDWRKLILEVELDPWTNKICRREKKYINKKIGKRKIRKSNLYRSPTNKEYIIKKNTNLGSFNKLIDDIGFKK